MDISEQPQQVIPLTPEMLAAIAQAVAAQLAAQPVAPPPPVVDPTPPLGEPLWTAMIHYVKHDSIDARWEAWLREKLGDKFDAYAEAYSPGGKHHFGKEVWNRVP